MSFSSCLQESCCHLLIRSVCLYSCAQSLWGWRAAFIAGSLLDQPLPFLPTPAPSLKQYLSFLEFASWLPKSFVMYVRCQNVCESSETHRGVQVGVGYTKGGCRRRDNLNKLISQFTLITEIQAKKQQSHVNTMVTCKMLLSVEFHWRFPYFLTRWDSQ